MIRVFVSGMLAGMGLYSEVRKMKLEAALRAAQTEIEKLKTPRHCIAMKRNCEAECARQSEENK